MADSSTSSSTEAGAAVGAALGPPLPVPRDPSHLHKSLADRAKGFKIILRKMYDLRTHKGRKETVRKSNSELVPFSGVEVIKITKESKDPSVKRMKKDEAGHWVEGPRADPVFLNGPIHCNGCANRMASFCAFIQNNKQGTGHPTPSEIGALYFRWVNEVLRTDFGLPDTEAYTLDDPFAMIPATIDVPSEKDDDDDADGLDDDQDSGDDEENVE